MRVCVCACVRVCVSKEAHMLSLWFADGFQTHCAKPRQPPIAGMLEIPSHLDRSLNHAPPTATTIQGDV